MADIFSGTKVLIAYDKNEDSALFCATDTNFPKTLWSNDIRKVVSENESRLYKIKFEGSQYLSEQLTVRNRVVIGNTNTWATNLPEPQKNYNAFIDGNLFVSKTVATPEFRVSEKKLTTIDYEVTVEFTSNTTAGRIILNNVKPYDSLTKKTFTVLNSYVKLSNTNENLVSTVFINVIGYTQSLTTPVVAITNIANGSFSFEISNFTNSGDDVGQLRLNYFVV